MIKAEIDAKSDVPDKLYAFGSTALIAAELASAIGQIYSGLIKSGNKMEAARFRIELVIALMPDSPAWKFDETAKGTVVSIDLGAMREEEER